MEALRSAHGIAQTIEALTNSQALYLGTFATVERLRNSILAEAQGGFAGGNAGLSSEQKAEDHGELTRLRGACHCGEVGHVSSTMPDTERTIGRPTIRSPEIADAICEGLARGQSLYRIVEQPGMPSYAAVMAWLREDREFQEQYTRGRDSQADFLAEEAIEIADKGSGDVQRDRLRIDARMWYAGKLRPKKYGAAKSDGPIFNVGVQVGVLTDERRMELIRKKRLANAEG